MAGKESCSGSFTSCSPPKSCEYYHARFKEVSLCLHGLIEHGAYLASHGEEEQLPVLRDLICRLAAYWPENPETDDPIKRQTQYGALFDKAVSDVRNGGQASELGEDRKENILIGLENYIIDVASQFPEINQEALDWGLAACETVAANLRQTWEETAQTQKSPQAFGPVLG